MHQYHRPHRKRPVDRLLQNGVFHNITSLHVGIAVASHVRGSNRWRFGSQQIMLFRKCFE